MNKFFCAEASRQAGEAMIGSASPYETYVLIECPTPWTPAAFDSPQIPASLKALIAEKQPERSLRFLLITRHPHAHPHSPLTKVLIYQQEKQEFSSGYRKCEFDVADLDQAASVIRSYLSGKIVSSTTNPSQDVLICTHGSHDKCCAKYGLLFYRQAIAIAAPLENLRIWQSSHFGGHRFAPTAISFPDGRYYGNLNAGDFQAIATRTGNIQDLSAIYRGWSMLPAPLQVMERKLLLEYGWNWFDYKIAYRVLGQSLDGNLIQAELSFQQPDQTIHIYHADLLKDHCQSVCLKGSCDASKASLFVKYAVDNLRLHSLQAVCLSQV
ncbi:MAG: sucrase ferredoxin [Leptolyngbyaceae cyanobacterium CRU_2_3]|nr:sucrase ferredoxin [Leptolyngbyaceae cyanobacterium CRU_2_3]